MKALSITEIIIALTIPEMNGLNTRKFTIIQGDSKMSELIEIKQLPIVDSNIHFFGVHVQTVPSKWRYKEEAHHAFEINYVLKGKQRTVIGGEHMDCEAGSFLVIPPGIRHTNENIGSGVLTYFCMHVDINEPLLRAKMMRNVKTIYQKDSIYYDELTFKMDQIRSLLKYESFSIIEKLQAQIYVLELLKTFAEMLDSEKDSNDLSNTEITYAREISSAIKWEFKRYSLENDEMINPIRIQKLIGNLGISPGHGLEIFKKVYDISPQEYLISLKFDEAKALLKRKDLSILQIANRCGYKNISHFSRQFKLWSGMNPSQYRQEKEKIWEALAFEKMM